jgi:penicillin-binding protein 1B
MPRRRRRASSRRRAPKARFQAARTLRRALLALLVLAVGYAAWLDIRVRSEFEGRRWQVPARVYARPLELYPGAPVTLAGVVQELEAAGYHPQRALARPASYRRERDRLELRTRRFRFWDAEEPERRLSVRFDGSGVVSLSEGGVPASIARLEPVLVGRFHPADREDRVLVRLDEVPRALVAALLAIEDRRFFEHSGVSFRGMARALVANLRAGDTVQGGSTLTQQLAKSYFLTAERSLWRKLNDIAIAVILELRYSKREILEAYLNEVYLGQDGPRAIHGFGLAARHYFGRELEELNLPEVALLAGLVRGPSLYNPRRHPQRARERRRLVLEAMAALGMLTPDQARRADAVPLGVTARSRPGDAPYGAFMDLVRRQLARDYRDEDLRSEGLRVFTTLDPGAQRSAQEALVQTLEDIERRRRREERGLQGAVVVTAPQSGEVLAVVGARDPARRGFNRALDARRPVGSLIKPVVYLGALSDPERFSLATLLPDTPVRLQGARGEVWEPKNYDGETHGPVALIHALAQSYNLASVRLGLRVGLEKVTALLADMGVERHVPRYPSLLLGAVDLSPLTVAQVYQTIASGGFRQPLRAIREVTDARGQPLMRYGLEVRPAVDTRAAYLVRRAMEEVMRSGTGRGARDVAGPGVRLAGKTGSTDDLRDSWFAGFGGGRLAVVWVGHDDNRSARLTGAAGALRVFAHLFARLDLRPVVAPIPEGIEWRPALVAQGRVLGVGCDGSDTVRLPFIRGASTAASACGAQPSAAATGVAGHLWGSAVEDAR